MKYVILLLVALVFSNAMTVRGNLQSGKVNVKEIEQILEGLVEGIFKESFPIQDCINDSEEIIKDFEEVVQYLEKGVHIDNIGKALEKIGDAVKKVPAVVKECEGCKGILREIEKVALLFSNPVKYLEKVGTNIFFHHKEISKEIKEARNNWKAKNYKQFGIFCGEIVATALKQLNGEHLGLIEFIQHYWEAAFNETLEITQCEDGINNVYNVTLEAWKMIKNGQYPQAITYIMAYFPEIKREAIKCEATLPAFMDGINQFKKINSVDVAVEAITAAFLKHFVEIPKDVSEAFWAITRKEWDLLGDALGDITGYVLEGL